ncbi:MAG: DEAD/DEAH box helicase [Lentisphaeraceae bacterium]|nr:DEAD/DEAH box helicase [Lentisphaeraceae bacterium]
MSFEKLGLSSELLTSIKFQGYVNPTPIQEKAIPVVLSGKDILAGAQTGTGKTAAFTLPLLQLLSTSDKPGGQKPKALILAPTRELAAQVGESVETYGKGLHIRSTVIFGGVGVGPQVQRLKKGMDIVVGTPGRLLDLAGQKALDLSKIEYLILDEADRMLDMGFIHDIRKIIKLVPRQRQTLFFSATYSKEIKELSDTILHKPVQVEVARQNTAAETVDQCVYKVAKNRKKNLVAKLIKDGDWSQVLVFTKTKHGANRLAQQLEKDGITTAAIHGNKSQSARTKALASFKSLKVQALIATDIAARGLDIDRLPHVINYELPMVAEDYVHRIGRTGRAGCSGEAISLVSDEEGKLLRAIERLMKKEIPVKQVKGYSQSEKEQAHNESVQKSAAKKQGSKPKNHSSRKPSKTNKNNQSQKDESGDGTAKKSKKRYAWWRNKK